MSCCQSEQIKAFHLDFEQDPTILEAMQATYRTDNQVKIYNQLLKTTDLLLGLGWSPPDDKLMVYTFKKLALAKCLCYQCEQTITPDEIYALKSFPPKKSPVYQLPLLNEKMDIHLLPLAALCLPCTLKPEEPAPRTSIEMVEKKCLQSAEFAQELAKHQLAKKRLGLVIEEKKKELNKQHRIADRELLKSEDEYQRKLELLEKRKHLKIDVNSTMKKIKEQQQERVRLNEKSEALQQTISQTESQLEKLTHRLTRLTQEKEQVQQQAEELTVQTEARRAQVLELLDISHQVMVNQKKQQEELFHQMETSLKTVRNQHEQALEEIIGLAEEQKMNLTGAQPCPVCYSPMEEPIALIDCGHVYCSSCINLMAECPTCRKSAQGRLKLFF